MGDLALDHVTVHSRGNARVDALPHSAMSTARVHLMADGRVHRVKVSYLPYVAAEYLDNFTATEHAISLGAVVDFGENRRLGTLIVWIDEGIASDTPIVAVPLNLAVRRAIPSFASRAPSALRARLTGRRDLRPASPACVSVQALLTLPQEKAVVGFTAATGLRW